MTANCISIKVSGNFNKAPAYITCSTIHQILKKGNTVRNERLAFVVTKIAFLVKVLFYCFGKTSLLNQVTLK